MKLEGVPPRHRDHRQGPGERGLLRGALGLRMVKKTVNQDDPTVYHLFYADEQGDAGSDITFFEYPGARPGRAGAGMVHTVGWRVASDEALDFWEKRLGEAGGQRARRRRCASRILRAWRTSCASRRSPTSR